MITYVEIQNFKSYKNYTKIGPLTNLTCIVGPNGSGKSNFIDAICFCLGITNNNLRINSVNELKNDPRIPSFVALYLKLDNKNKDEYILKREIYEDSKCRYFINQKVVSFGEYQELLMNFNIYNRIKNFIIFQGDINSIAGMNQKQLTDFFEYISGSGNLKDEYENALKEYNDASQKCVHAFEIKKEIMHKIKENEKSKEKQIELQEILERKKKLSMLVTLCKIKEKKDKIEEIDSEIKNYDEEIKKIDNFITNGENEMKKEELEFAINQKESIKIQRELSDDKEKLEEIKRNILEEKDKIIENKRQCEEIKQKIYRTNESINKLNDESMKYDNELKEIENNFQDFLSKHENKIIEYEKIKEIMKSKEEEFQEKFKNEILEIENLKLEIFKIENQKIFIEDKKLEIETEIKKLEKNKNQLIIERNLKIEMYDKLVNEIENLKNSHEQKLKSYNLICEKEKVKNSELNQITTELINMKEQKREISKKINIKRIVDHLKSIFTGVFGRIVDLIQPTQKKYELPISVLLGLYDQAVVVDNEETAIKCIDFLKSQKMLRLTFLPLSNLRNFKIFNKNDLNIRNDNNELEYLSDNDVILTTSAISFDNKYSNAINTILGNTIITRNTEIAKNILFKRNIKINISTLDGVYFHKSGSITGGNLKNKFDTENNLKIIEKRTQLFSDLKQIQNQKLEFLDIEIVSQKLELLNEKLELLKKEINEINIEKIQNQINIQTKTLKEIEKQSKPNIPNFNKFLNLENNFFKNILQNSVFENYQNFKEFKSLNINERIIEKNLLIDRIKNMKQINILEIQDKSEYLKELNEHFNKYNNKNSNLNESESPLIIEYEKLKDKIKILEENYINAENNLNILKEKLKLKNENVNQMILKNNENTKKLINIKSIRFQLIDEIKEIIKYAELEKINLPKINNNHDKKYLHNDNNSFNDSDLKTIELNYNFKIIKDTHSNYNKEIQNLNLKIDKLLSQIEINDNEYLNNDSNYEKLKEEVKIKKQKFIEIKQKRIELFLECFKFINENINFIYKDLVGFDINSEEKEDKKDNDNIKGDIKDNNKENITNIINNTIDNKENITNIIEESYITNTNFNIEDIKQKSSISAISLVLENTNIPFNDGIKFYVMPPNKRYREIKYLSGGEKTMAILSLIFSIYKYKPSPFLIFDEIDSALDKINVKKVINYLLKINTQSIIISLKPNFYQYAELLVGVYKKDNQSKVLGFRM